MQMSRGIGRFLLNAGSFAIGLVLCLSFGVAISSKDDGICRYPRYCRVRLLLYRALGGSNASDLPIPASPRNPTPPAVDQAERPLPNAPKRTKDAPGAPGRWLAKDERTQIHDLLIPGGLIYVGASLTKISRYGVEPALINPRLPIAVSDQHADMPYWPSYSEISPAARGGYLLWLSGGRQSPAANRVCLLVPLRAGTSCARREI